MWALLVLGCGRADHAAQSASPVSSTGPKAIVLNAGLKSPWGIVFLPDGRMLVTQKAGSMAVLSADGRNIEQVVGGLPPVADAGQGGLLGLALDPDFGQNQRIFWAYSEPGAGAEAGLSGTAVARGVLAGNVLKDVQVIYRQVPKVDGSGHFGARIVFRPDKTMFVTLGERQKGTPAQDPATTLGKVIRIDRDGHAPPDNPSLVGARPEVWSLGHRNPQGAAIRPGSDELWITEHGPQGGDELNRVVAGANYGWPSVSYGCNYGDRIGDACRIGGGVHAPKFIEPVKYWVPVSIAPAGMMFYSGKRFPQWAGNVFFGALAGTALWRVRLEGRDAVAAEPLLRDLGERIRDVAEGPDGGIYFVTDSGRLMQLRD